LTKEILFKERIRAEILKILSGYSFRERGRSPRIIIMIPWIWGDVVTLEIDQPVYEADPFWFKDVYGIKTINLPYALLLLKLDFGAEITIVTKTPEKKDSGYGAYAPDIRRMLDFLDEIGCNIFLNDKFHAKLLLSNDLAILGSMNLSNKALDPSREQEEIAVSIDSLSSLSRLEAFARELIEQSTPNSYTYMANDWWGKHPCPIQTKLTRGWIYENIVYDYFNEKFGRETRRGGNVRYGDSFSEFLRIDLLKENAGSSMYEIAKDLSCNLNDFYFGAIRRYLQPSRFDYDKNTQYSLLYTILGYRGKIDMNDVAMFFEERLARKQMPEIKPILCPIE